MTFSCKCDLVLAGDIMQTARVKMNENGRIVLPAEFRRELGIEPVDQGDRACLELGIKLGLPVCTTDRAWENLNAGVNVFIVP